MATAQYPVADLLATLKASDANGDALSIPKLTLRYPDRGDRLTYRKSTAAWEYYCASDQGCANYLGNELVASVSDGVNSVTGVLIQPVKPRPGGAVVGLSWVVGLRV